MTYSILMIVGFVALLGGLLFSKNSLHVALMQIAVSVMIGTLLLVSQAFDGLLLYLLETLALINALLGVAEVLKMLRKRPSSRP